MYVFLKNGHFWMTATVHKKKITIAVVGKHRIKYLTSYKSIPTLITYYNLTANIQGGPDITCQKKSSNK
jgi:hypothetical protein